MVAYSGELLGKLSCTPFRLIRELGFAMVDKEKGPAGETGQKGGAAAINGFVKFCGGIGSADNGGAIAEICSANDLR